MQHSAKIIEQLKDSARQEALVSEPEESSRDEGEGRWQKQPALGVRLLWPDKNGSSAGKTILYSWISDDIDFEQDAEGNGTITFCYENNRGEFRVTIEGRNLEAMYVQLSEGRRLSVRLQGGVRSLGIREVAERVR